MEPCGDVLMNKRVLRSVLAIPLGWIVSLVGCIVTMIVISIFNREALKPGVQPSVELLLVTLLVSFVFNIVGGYVTGVIAQRSEIRHAIVLVLFMLLLSVTIWRTTQTPHWYTAVARVSVIPAILLGGWLRMKQRILLDRGSEAVIKATDNVRFVMVAIISFVTFLLVLFLGTELGGAGLWWTVRLLSGEDPYPPPTLLPVFVVSLILASVLARRLFRRIIGGRASLMSDGAAKDGK